MPYHVIIQREYVYRNQNNDGKVNNVKTPEASRTVEQPVDSIDPNSPKIKVNMSNIAED
jgi:hypothetical protein